MALSFYQFIRTPSDQCLMLLIFFLLLLLEFQHQKDIRTYIYPSKRKKKKKSITEYLKIIVYPCATCETGTYQETCIDGFGEAEEALKSSVFNNLKNSTEFTSNSLAIVTWLDKAASAVKLRRLLSTLPHQDEEPKWLHSKDRKMLQADNLKKKANIVVAKDGSGNFKTITAALKHVPEKSDKRTVIYVKKGIYNENVRVEKTKWNVMIIGDGMNATIVSGRLNFVDGNPTFSSATFGM